MFAITEATAVGLFPPTLPLRNIIKLIIVSDALIFAYACIGFLITEYPFGFQLALTFGEQMATFLMSVVSLPSLAGDNEGNARGRSAHL